MTLWDEMKNHWYIYETIAPVPENSRSVVMGRGLEVVRCKECKYYGIFDVCTINGRCEPMEADDFCSKGVLYESNTSN